MLESLARVQPTMEEIERARRLALLYPGSIAKYHSVTQDYQVVLNTGESFRSPRVGGIIRMVDAYLQGGDGVRPEAPPCPPLPHTDLVPWTWDQAKEFCRSKEIQFPVEAAHRAVEEYVRQQNWEQQCKSMKSTMSGPLPWKEV